MLTPALRRLLRTASIPIGTLALVPLVGVGQPPVSASVTEYVTNASVETTLAPWTSTYSTSSRVERTTGGYDGTYAVRTTNTRATAADVGFRDKPSQVTNTVAGRSYDLSVWVRSEVAGKTINLKVKELTSTGASPGAFTQSLQAPDTEWHPIQLSYIARGTGNALSFIVYSTAVGPNQAFWADLFSASETSTDPPPSALVGVPSVLETVPTGTVGDTADDPAIWVNASDPAASLVITNEKRIRRLSVFNLSGQVVQRISTPAFVGNVDVRQDIVAASVSGVRLWRVQAGVDGPQLVAAQEATGNAATGGEGLCLYDPGDPGIGGGLYAINVNRSTNQVRMHPLTDADADTLLQVQPAVRSFYLGSEGEGCVVDDVTGALYLSEEDVGIWRYDLTAAGQEPPRVRFASLDVNLVADVEGLTLVDGVLIASAQNVASPRNNWFSRYDATTGQHLGRFRVVDGTTSDDCDQTDGIDAYGGDLGPAFPKGLFVCQDGYNDPPGSSGTQDFKFAPLQLINGIP